MTTLKQKLMTYTMVGALALSSISAVHAKPQTYTIDPSHTAIMFHIDHFGFSKPSGKFMDISGSITLDEDTPANSMVEVSIPIEKVNTGLPALNKHLLSEDFFNVLTYPNATFKSTNVKITSDKTAKVTGNLTMHGVTKPVTLDVTLNKIALNSFEKQTAGFTASTTIKRSDFGITTYLPGLADEVTIEIESEANL